LFNSDFTVPAVVDASDPGNKTVTIPETTIDQSGSTWTISGSGTIATCSKKITMTIVINDTAYGYNDYTYKTEYYF
jgi:hypothetical protein